MPYPRSRGLGSTAPTNVDDFGSVVRALGLAWTPDIFGFNSWTDALTWIESGNGTTALASGGRGYVSPSGAEAAGLVALADVWMVAGRTDTGYLPTAAQVVSTLGVTGTDLAPGPKPPDVPVSNYDWQQYAGAVIDYAPQVVALYAAYAPGELAPTPEQQAAIAWNVALQSGPTTRVPDDNVAGYADIPTSAITEGPVTLPDGTVYTIAHWPGSETSDGQSVFWHSPTGALNGWYIGRVTGIDRIIDPLTGAFLGYATNPPAGFNGPWDLISPRALAALSSQGGALLSNILTGEQPAPITYGGVTLPVQAPPPGPTSGPSAQLVLPSGTGSGDLGPAPTIVTQDMDGNPVPPQPAPTQNTPPVVVQQLPPTPAPSGAASQQLVAPTGVVTTFTPSLLLVALVAGATYLMARGGRR